MRPKVYLAAPLFNPRERSFNSELAGHLDAIADVFLPQRDGSLLTRLMADGHSLVDARRRIYKVDVEAIRACDVVVALLDGRTVDEGVAFEIGFGRALDKVCVALKTDDRSLLLTGDNPMIVGGCQYHCSTVGQLVGIVAEVTSYHRQEAAPRTCSALISANETARRKL